MTRNRLQRAARNGVLIAWACTVFSASAAGPNLIANGDFETGDFSDWDQSPSNAYFGVDDRGALSGNFSAYFGSVTGTADFISQAVTTTPGAAYTVTFRLDSPFSSQGQASFEGDFGGVTFLSLSNTDPNFSNKVFSFTVKASSSMSLLKFSATNSAYYYLLDDINVAAVPEGGTAPLMALGLSLLVLARRFRASPDEL